MMEKIIEHFGSRAALARALNIHPTAVSKWISRGNVPPARAIDIQNVTEGKFSATAIMDANTYIAGMPPSKYNGRKKA